MKSIMLGLLLLLAGAVAYIFTLAPHRADARFNRVSQPPPYQPAAEAQRLHERLRVVDLHADFLLWDRNLLQRYTRGHVDKPRLDAGNVAVQVFSVVTKSPWGQNYERTEGDSDRITLLALAQRWPTATWRSLKARALHQARRLHEAAARSGGEVVVVRTADDLEHVLARRAAGAPVVGGLLALEGMHALDGDLGAIDELYAAGYRMMAPTHMFDNRLAGSAQGAEGYGLTDFGRAAIERLQALGIIIDLAHVSAAAIDDVLAMATGPVVVSHTGVRGTCDSPRNLSDEQLRALAATGGVVGIGFWDTALCGGTDAAAIAAAIRYAADVMGAEHVALGSDFDGTVKTAFDASGMALLTEALLAEGFTEEEIAGIMGENALRVFRAVLPRGTS